MKLGGLSMTLGVAAALALLIVGASLSTTAGSNPDADNDGVVDLVDNCTGKFNAVNAQGWQDDCDLDGFGDECDGDLNNSGLVNIQDFLLFGQAFNKPLGSPGFNPCADMNTSGLINIQDFLLFGQQFNAGLPGPSGLKCASDVPGSKNLTGQQRCWFLPNHRVRCPLGSSGADHHGILTNSDTGRDLRFTNHRHYGDQPGKLGAHCI